jgi:hypothetical protein
MQPIYLLVALCFVISACGPSSEQLTSTVVVAQAQTQTAAPTLIPSPTATPVPTQTSTPIPVSLIYNPVPRWMILGQPGHSVEILGETWNYADDRWGETYGCIDYTRETGAHIYFEQCFALVDNTITFESQHTKFLEDDFEILTPKNTFGNIGQISLLGKRLVGNPKKTIEFFELIGTEKYILLVELYIETDENDPLQTIYEDQVADIIDYVLQNSLQKSRLIPRPTATPLSPNQASFYDDLAAKLITDEEASILYSATWIGEAEGSIDGTWEALGDNVRSDRTQVCRVFEDRTNVDVRWVQFQNCIFVTKEIPFESIADYYKQPGDIVLVSSHKFEGDYALYGYNDGRTFFDAYLLDGGFIYHVSLTSRTLTGETVEDVFNQTIDDFIYNVLMINVKN